MTNDVRRGSYAFRFALAALLGLSMAIPATAGVPLTGVGSLAEGTPLATKAKAKYKAGNKNVYVKKNVYVNKNVRRWSRKPYYGNVIAGVALGTVLGVAAAGNVPPPPAPNLCWYWTNPYKNRGYWDYCY